METHRRFLHRRVAWCDSWFENGYLPAVWQMDYEEGEGQGWQLIPPQDPDMNTEVHRSQLRVAVTTGHVVIITLPSEVQSSLTGSSSLSLAASSPAHSSLRGYALWGGSLVLQTQRLPMGLPLQALQIFPGHLSVSSGAVGTPPL